MGRRVGEMVWGAVGRIAERSHFQYGLKRAILRLCGSGRLRIAFELVQ